MAAGAWKVFNQIKQRALAGGNLLDGALRLLVLDNTAEPTLGLTSTATAAIANNLASNLNPNTKLYIAGETTVTATGNNYFLDITTSAVFTATGSNATVGWLVLAEATDGDLVCYCDIDTATTAGTVITPGNTLTVTYPAAGIFRTSGAT